MAQRQILRWFILRMGIIDDTHTHIRRRAREHADGMRLFAEQIFVCWHFDEEKRYRHWHESHSHTHTHREDKQNKKNPPGRKVIITTKTAHFTFLSRSASMRGYIVHSFLQPFIYHLTKSVSRLSHLSLSRPFPARMRNSNVTFVPNVALTLTQHTRRPFMFLFPNLRMRFDIEFSIIFVNTFPNKYLEIRSFDSAMQFVDECDGWQHHLALNFVLRANMYFPLKTSETSEKIYFFNEIVLPWQLSEWKIEVTSPTSTTEIWARLLETDYKVSGFGKWNQY